MAAIRTRLTYANVTATIALFLALGGTGVYAAKKLKLKNNSVTTPKIADAAVTGPKLAAGAVTADKLGPGAVPQSPSFPPSLPPSGPAGGDLTGTYPAPKLKPLQTEAPPFLLSLCNFSTGEDWENYDPAQFSTAAYSRDAQGIVRLQGTINCPSASGQPTILTLPAGYAPARDVTFPGRTDDGNTLIRVQSSSSGGFSGNVNAVGAAPTAGEGVYLDGLSFRCAPSGQNGCP